MYAYRQANKCNDIKKAIKMDGGGGGGGGVIQSLNQGTINNLGYKVEIKVQLIILDGNNLNGQ